MVLKELISLWHDDSALADIFKEFDNMLILAKEMFQMVSSEISEGKISESIGPALREKDIELNKLQRRIRRDSVTHITVQGTGDLVFCMQLMSLTKDAERIGDYCKNIHEIISKIEGKLKGDPIFPDLIDMKNKMLIWFDQTKRAFDRADRDLAIATREEAYLHEKECDRQVWALSANNQGRNAVGVAMLIRFFKRITAHLGNICTSVVMPIDKLDYFTKPDGSLGSDED
jgi:phosphate uptake regulator